MDGIDDDDGDDDESDERVVTLVMNSIVDCLRDNVVPQHKNHACNSVRLVQ